MQEATVIHKEGVNVKDKKSEFGTKYLKTKISITRTILDYVNYTFTTVCKNINLKNKLEPIEKNDKDFIYNPKDPIYKSLKEKPKYEANEEIIRTGSISEVNKKQKHFNPLSYPYKFW